MKDENFYGAMVGVCGEFEGLYIKIGRGISVGRDPETSKLVMENETISRKHCTITYDTRTAEYYVLDYSHNGILNKDGSRIPSGELCSFHEEDVIYIGNSENAFRFL